MRSWMVFCKRLFWSHNLLDFESANSTHMWKLKKSLYGLKEAPHAWFDRFSKFLLSQGFYSSNADPSLFILKRDDNMVILLIYVGSMLIIGYSSSLLYKFLQQLSTEFAMKDLWQIHYFQGMQVHCLSNVLFLSQQRYATTIL